MAKILIGITGSIAAYKIIELTHELKKLGHEIKVVLTRDALNFVTPMSYAAFSAEVYSDEINPYQASNVMQHIELARWPDLIVIAPLSANSLSKIACGFADNLLTATILAATKPIYMAPAMNMHMWQNKIVQANLSKLKLVGMTVWGPDKGLQACGDNGIGRMIEACEILSNITHQLLTQDKLFNDKKVVITAGSTIEEIDPVRYISNHSSGKMGYALARAFASHGANVCLISGNTNLANPNSATQIIKVKSAQDMFDAAIKEAAIADIFVGCAAVSDYGCVKYSQHKIKKQDSMSLELTKNPDIIATVKQRFPHLFVVGFAAETQNLIDYAKQKIKSKNLDLIIANSVADCQVFGSDDNEVSIIDKNHTETKLGKNNKNIIAHQILQFIHTNNQP